MKIIPLSFFDSFSTLLFRPQIGFRVRNRPVREVVIQRVEGFL